MSATQFLMVMAMLAVVLGVMGIALRLIRRYAMNTASARGNVKMEVIHRLSLGQKQGLAVVRIGTRVLAVSMGEGGVHQVAELSDTDLSFAREETKATASSHVHAIADGIRRLALVRSSSDAATDSDHATQPAALPASTEAGFSIRGRFNGRGDKRISYVAPIEDFQAVLSMAMAGGAHA